MWRARNITPVMTRGNPIWYRNARGECGPKVRLYTRNAKRPDGRFSDGGQELDHGEAVVLGLQVRSRHHPPPRPPIPPPVIFTISLPIRRSPGTIPSAGELVLVQRECFCGANSESTSVRARYC